MSSLRIRCCSLAIVIGALLVAAVGGSSSSNAQEMSGEAMETLLSGGKTLTLGGPGEGYVGSVVLQPDGTGVGSAVMDSGKKLDISGTWRIEDDRFCRKWKFNDYEEVCETWRKIGENKVEVLVKGKRVGVNAW